MQKFVTLWHPMGVVLLESIFMCDKIYANYFVKTVLTKKFYVFLDYHFMHSNVWHDKKNYAVQILFTYATCT